MKSAQYGAVDRGERCQYNRTPAKQRIKKEFSLPENSAPGRMPGRNEDAVFVDEDDGMPLLFRHSKRQPLG